jgi:hypothetical protein
LFSKVILSVSKVRHLPHLPQYYRQLASVKGGSEFN